MQVLLPKYRPPATTAHFSRTPSVDPRPIQGATERSRTIVNCEAIRRSRSGCLTVEGDGGPEVEAEARLDHASLAQHRSGDGVGAPVHRALSAPTVTRRIIHGASMLDEDKTQHEQRMRRTEHPRVITKPTFELKVGVSGSIGQAASTC